MLRLIEFGLLAVALVVVRRLIRGRRTGSHRHEAQEPGELADTAKREKPSE